MLERWVSAIKSGPGKRLSPDFFVSEPRSVLDVQSLEVIYLVAGKDGWCGLEEGVYVIPNIDPTTFNNNPILRRAIGAQFKRDLYGKHRVVVEGCISIDEAVKVIPSAVDSRGAIVLRILPILPSDLEQHLRSQR